jgi:hypothetical protein
MSYYNTTSEAGAALAGSHADANQQETAIMALFRRHGTLTPWQAHALLGGHYEITSVRRAITDLTSRERLAKLPALRKGPKGKSEHFWTLAEQAKAAA